MLIYSFDVIYNYRDDIRTKNRRAIDNSKIITQNNQNMYTCNVSVSYLKLYLEHTNEEQQSKVFQQHKHLTEQVH